MKKTSQPNYQHTNVVLVDDDSMVLHTLQAALEDMGFSVTPFTDPLKSIEWIQEHGADIVISDICMPKHDGFEVLKTVKELSPQCNVIFITAHSQMDIAIRALREGATDFIEKPITGATLGAAIERTNRFRMLAMQESILSDKVTLLSCELEEKNKYKNIMIGKSEPMKHLAEDIVDLSTSNATVLILGESGTGKELVANGIHMLSNRKTRPFLTLNCPSIPEDLFESEMFGHRRGAFTGAIETRSGYVEAATGGTLFLDEIGDLPIKSQAKILRLLEQHTYVPVGEHKERISDVRIIAATNQPLENLVKKKLFREDLFYRLSVCTLKIPPLRERKEDIPLLALYFILQLSAEMGKSISGIDNKALNILTQAEFPGNIRELKNLIESSIIHCKHDGTLTSDDLPKTGIDNIFTKEETWSLKSLEFKDVETQLYQEALKRTNSNISAAARVLGLSRGKLRRRLEALNIKTQQIQND